MYSDDLTIQHWLTRHAKYKAHKTAIVCGDQRQTFAELNANVNQLVHALQQSGVCKGDKVATILSNSIELWEIYWACAKMGAVAVPLSPLLRGSGLANLIDNADAKLVITDKETAQYVTAVREALTNVPTGNFWLINTSDMIGYRSYHAQKAKQPVTEPEVEPVTGSDPYNIIYSSGTTGLPKGIVISHAVRALYGSLFANSYRMTPESVVMHSGSIIFNGSFLTLMPAMFLGCTYVLQDHFDPQQVIAAISEESVTHTILVPSQIIACLQQPQFSSQTLPSIEYILSVGAPLLLEHKQELNKRIPGVFYELYGLTEGFMTILDKTDAARKTGSVGYAPSFMEMKICNDSGEAQPAGVIGEIVGKGPLLMDGYYKNEIQTRETLRNGWLYTGDLGYVDEDGFLFLTGRKKDLIISGGVNVYPADIEEVVIKHPAVTDVAVFGVAHCEWGETPVAAVVVNTGEAEATSIKKWVNDHIDARFQKIHDIMIIRELPRNVAGKVLKRELKEQYENRK